MPRMKSIFQMLLIALVLCGVIAGAGVYYIQQPTSATGETKTIFVEPGMALSKVASQLEEEELIRSVSWFKLMARYQKVENQIKVGRYRIDTGLSVDEILATLVSGKGGTESVTIPEGLTIKEVAAVLKEKVAIDSLQFVTLAKSSDFAAKMGIDAPTLEGYLFPNTYQFYYKMEPELVIQEMTSLFHDVLSKEDLEAVKQRGMNLQEVITLASIIEREAQLASERELISGVFHNRLKIGRALESCATVQYILGKPKAVLLNRDLKIPSPYNTYLHRGLPPGPICSPGASAIQAALYPAKTRYLYFVARGDGGHVFSRSNREHINAKNRIKRNQT